MSELIFLIINASVVCFIASYCLLKIFRSKVLLVCLVVSPFILIPVITGSLQELLIAYLFILQYGCLGIAFGILLFEIDQIKRARKLRYLTSFVAKIVIIFPSLYLFLFIAKQFISHNRAIEHSIEIASAFGFIEEEYLVLIDSIDSYFTFIGAVLSIIIILLCLTTLIFNKYRAFKEVQRI
ncbi:MAG: hypothetical protein ACRBHB_09690 [Arenicella sp.]